jgi:hypothetical protein
MSHSVDHVRQREARSAEGRSLLQVVGPSLRATPAADRQTPSAVDRQNSPQAATSGRPLELSPRDTSNHTVVASSCTTPQRSES